MIRAFKKNAAMPEKVNFLLKKGVRMTAPFSVEIGEEVDLKRIDGSLIIYGAARIYGDTTLISPGVKLGYEAPVTLINCQLGKEVELKGGYFAESVFLDKAKMGSNAQIRAGCLLEEESSGNHTVGLKQTILLPFVTLGSLINFCDCLMAGGTSRKNHSEVGSSYIHFNYTPQQDKATPSLIGDVPRGVMLREAPIFLGGQGAITGPAQIAYGTVISAGIICRQDCLTRGMLWSSPDNYSRPKKFIPGVYGDISRKVNSNIVYIANLLALRQWYRFVRRDFFCQNKYGSALFDGACNVLDEAIAERIRQMQLFAQNLEKSMINAKKIFSASVSKKQQRFVQNWPRMEEHLSGNHEEKISYKKKEAFIKIIQRQSDKVGSYLDVIRSLTPQQAQKGTGWLNDIVEKTTAECLNASRALQQKDK